jgi:beta-1,4-N-acetylglucosaminyltransferase
MKMCEKKKLNILVVLGDGGHTMQMLKLVDLLGPKYKYNYLMGTIDKISEDRIRIKGPVYRVEPPGWKHKRHWTYLFWGAIWPVFKQLIILFKIRPKAILSTGAGLAVPISFWGRFLFGVKIIHIESGSRVYTMSLSGKLMYRIAHRFFVQWPLLQKDYPKSIYAGRLL